MSLAPAGVVILVIVGLLAWLAARVVAASFRNVARRKASLLAELERRGMSVTPDAPLPADLLVSRLTPSGGQPRKSFLIQRDALEIYLWDQVYVKHGPSRSSAAKNRRKRASLVAVRDPSADLPHFFLVPLAGRSLREFAGGAEQTQSIAPDSAAKGLARSLARAVVDLTEATERRTGVLPLDRRPDFAKSSRVYAEDSIAVDALLTDDVVDLLLEHPSLLASAGGSWLVLSRYLTEPSADRTDLPQGLLTEEKFAALVDLAVELRRRLGGPTA